MDRDNDFCILLWVNILSVARKANPLALIFSMVAAYSVSEFLNLIVQVLFRSIRGYLRLLLILGLVVMVILKACSPFQEQENGGFVPTVQDITCGDLQHTGSRPVNRQLLLTGYQQSLRNLLDQFPKIVVILLIN